MNFIYKIWNWARNLFVDNDIKKFTFNHAPFSDTDIDLILSVIKPLIKKFNNDTVFRDLCHTIKDSKVLKTYCTLSEDNKKLIINLTQSKLFNEKLANFIRDRAISEIKSSIDDCLKSKYKIEHEDGTIVIYKINN